MAATHKKSKLQTWKDANSSDTPSEGYGLADDGNYYPISTAREAFDAGDSHVFTGKACGRGHVAVRRVSWSRRAGRSGHVSAKCSACDSRGGMSQSSKVRHMIFEPIRSGRADAPADVLAMSRGEAPSASAEAWFESMVPFYQLVLALRLWEKDGVYSFPGDTLTVDHIVPLHGEVRGAHVPDNLQLITNSDNSRKSFRMSHVRRVRLQNWHSTWNLQEARDAFNYLNSFTESGLMSIYEAAEEYAQVLRDLSYGVPGGPDWVHPERIALAA